MKQSKMQQAQAIYNEVYAKGYDLQGKSERAVFMDRVVAELGMTKHGANTYHQNLRNMNVHGKSLYEYNKTAKKVVKDEAQANEVQSVAVVEEVKAIEPKTPEHRWYVVDESGDFLVSFPTRSKAQDHAKSVSGKWRDLEKHKVA